QRAKDGTVLVTGDDSELLVWDTAAGALRAIHADTDRTEMLDMCAPRSGAWLATVHVRGGRLGRGVGNPSVLKVWDLQGGGPPKILTEVRDGPYKCEVSQDGRWLVSHH